MITVIVQFRLPNAITREQAREVFASTAPRYQEIAGLIRKYYLLSEDGYTAGGVYTWASREDAERLYTEEWRKFILAKYACEPSVTYFETPVLVDNVSKEIVLDP